MKTTGLRRWFLYFIKKEEIEKTDEEIDKKVYGLYGLTEEEIRAVEKIK